MLDVLVVLHRVGAGIDHVAQQHRLEVDVVGPRVVEELVDDGVELRDVGRHVVARVLVGHAHLGFEPQARQRRAQVVRDAGQHHGAVLLDLGELVGHAVEADVDRPDLVGAGALVEPVRLVFAFAHLQRGPRQLLERQVDEARDQRRAGQRQRHRRHQPDQPGAPAQAA